MLLLFVLTTFLGIVKSQYDSSDGPVFSSCGSDITVDKGVITSPEYPGNYPNNQMCRWRVMTQVEDIEVRVTVDDLDIENARNCQYDFMSLRFAGADEQKFCGRTVEGNPHQGALPLTVNFGSDGSVGGKGFAMTFQVLSPCLSEPCQNGANCKYDNDSYTCECAEGWEGINCETEINECQSSPCRNGGICTDDVNQFTCACSPGVTGATCDVITDYCAYLRPCANGATCETVDETYVCACAVGYTGRNCDAEADECASNPCENGGTCNDMFARFQCDCVEGHRGERCEIVPTTTTEPSTTTTSTTTALTSTSQPSYCGMTSSIVCLNGGSCVVVGGVKEACLCANGYDGNRCENLARDSPDYLNALIATSAGSFICVLLMGAIVCLVLCKRKHANRCEVMQLGRRGGPGAENHVANSNKPQQAREAWGARHQTANDNTFINRKVEDESSHYDSMLPNFTPSHFGYNGNFYAANGSRYPGVQVGGKRRHSVVDDYSKPQADVGNTLPIYSVMQALDTHKKDNNMDEKIPSKPKTKQEGREHKQKVPRRHHPSSDVKIAPDAAATLINYLSNALKRGKPHSGKMSHDKSSSEALAIKSIVSDETTNQNPPPRRTDQSQRPVDKARHRGHFKAKRGEDDVRMDNLKLYDYFDQFASDKQGRAVLRLTRENAFLFE